MHHIDTLYLGYRSGSEAEHYRLLEQFFDSSLGSLGEAGGRQWLQLKHGRLGVMDYRKSLSSNQFDFLIQLDWALVSSLPMHDPVSALPEIFRVWQVVRIDITLVQTAQKMPIFEYAITPFRSGRVVFRGAEDRVETVYYGKRSAGAVFRLYDKGLEMEQSQAWQKMDFYGYDRDLGLTSAELEMRRKFLVRKLGRSDIRMSDWSEIYDLYLYMVSAIRFFDATPENLRAYHARNYDLVDHAWVFSDFLDLENEYVSPVVETRKTPSFSILRDRVEKMIRNFAQYADMSVIDVLDRLAVDLLSDGVIWREIMLDLDAVRVAQHDPYMSNDLYWVEGRRYFVEPVHRG
jgi:hypothetical protein